MTDEIYEKWLGTLDADTPDGRVALVQVAREGEQPTVEMRLQAWMPAVGWVTQRRIRIAPGQLPALLGALNLVDADARCPRVEPAAASTGSLTLVAC